LYLSKLFGAFCELTLCAFLWLLMGQRVLTSVYFCKEVGSVRSINGSQLAKSLLGIVDSVPVEVKKSEFQKRVRIAGPDVDGFFVGSLGRFPFFLLTKAVT
jgi:hypothetical protein